MGAAPFIDGLGSSWIPGFPELPLRDFELRSSQTRCPYPQSERVRLVERIGHVEWIWKETVCLLSGGCYGLDARRNAACGNGHGHS